MLLIGRDLISTPPPRRSSSISGASLIYSLALRLLSSTALEMILALPPMEVSSEGSTAVANLIFDYFVSKLAPNDSPVALSMADIRLGICGHDCL